LLVIDLLARACGVLYDDAASGAERRDIGGEQILVADKQTLIRTKQTIRPADHMDCEYLASRIAEEDRDPRL
jgi:hypothetical protein